ncbi:hypothetical protein CHH28_17865 [Bacterioplanes sanyensis]|uniref:Penicillin acylase family protein n=1 Tax=Bacterioplanes sanyensis TaxID=1249553 RepID=A0A222FN32_9GAMM|nr:hypothetical protein CHH28_17865 [Bacterioplanes sanyensis]
MSFLQCLLKRIVATLVLLLMSGCAALTTHPQPLTSQQRFQHWLPAEALASAPVQGSVVVRWNDYAVPFVTAEYDDDLPFALGLVHGHLRWGQMELLRHVAQGRVSALGGPISMLKTLDHGLRMLDLCASGEASWQTMLPESRRWLERFASGINFYIDQQLATNSPLPAELRSLSIEPAPFTRSDLMCINRLVAADLSWAVYLRYLKRAEEPGWQQAFNDMLKRRNSNSATFENPDDPALATLIRQLSKSGSNSLVVSGSKSASGAAMIASDPHVGLSLPNFWLLAGWRSPSYQAVGMMIPAVPIIGVGRNRDIAWGGTNMRGISSHLVDVSQLAPEQIQTLRHSIERRAWWDTSVDIRQTPHGPILTDLNYFEPSQQPFTVALDWVGRHGSDEIGAFLQVARAANWQQFRQAFSGYRVSAMNMLYADREGNIGLVPAYGQPILKDPSKTLQLVKSSDNTIQTVLSPTQLPNPFNPAAGFIASANNKPFANPQIPFGYAFAANDRYDRLVQWMQADEPVSVALLKTLQQDTFSASAHALKTDWLARSGDLQHELVEQLSSWDGRFQHDSLGALAFHRIMTVAWLDYQATHPQHEVAKDHWKAALQQWFAELSAQQWQQRLPQWLDEYDDIVRQQDEIQQWGDWLTQPQRPLLGAIPWLGRRYRLPAYPASGGNDTLNKSGHAITLEPQTVNYGASSRHISDLSSLDTNWFVLHGGQDGWLMSEHLADQTELWRLGDYMQLPLSDDGVEKAYRRYRWQLTPPDSQ